jgi:hypothetical protein
MKITFRGPKGAYEKLRALLELDEDEEIEEVIFDEDDNVMPEYQECLDQLHLRVTVENEASDFNHVTPGVPYGDAV